MHSLFGPHDVPAGHVTLPQTTELEVERVAHAVGFASAAVLRHHFQRQMGLSPVAYRRQFASLLADAPA